jgi:hypothetical protein
MKNSRLVFITGIAVLIVIALAMWSRLLTSPSQTGTSSAIAVPPQPRYETALDRPRPELRIERLLGLDNSNPFNPDIASLFKNERERRNETVNQPGTTYQQFASVSDEKRGGLSNETGILRDATRQR